jgi:hypothetical protein
MAHTLIRLLKQLNKYKIYIKNKYFLLKNQSRYVKMLTKQATRSNIIY